MNYIEENKKDLTKKYICEICGRRSFKKNKLLHMVLCSKHMHQILKHGKALDNNPRTNNDLNDYRIEGNIVVFDTYNQKNVKNAEFIIDLEDLNKVKYHKWRLSHSHIVTRSGVGNIRDIAHILLGIKKEDIKRNSLIVVDHINGNSLDNRKVNLRITTQGKNVCNKRFMSNNTSDFIGVGFDHNRGQWTCEIRYEGKRTHLKRWHLKEEAVYAIIVADKLLFKEYQNKEELLKKIQFVKSKKLPIERREEIKNYVFNKLNKVYKLH